MTTSEFNLSGRVGIVAQIGSALGETIAQALAAAGAAVGTAGIARLAGLGGGAPTGVEEQCATVPADPRDPDQAEGLISDLARSLGHIDILINVLPIVTLEPLLNLAPQDWHRVWKVDLQAAFRLSQAACREMLPRGHGKIINVYPLSTTDDMAFVSASRLGLGAIEQLTKTLASEWASYGINVNAIAARVIDTEKSLGGNHSVLNEIPARRRGRPDDVVGAVVFLASSASDYVHGHVLVVDGGWLVRAG